MLVHIAEFDESSLTTAMADRGVATAENFHFQHPTSFLGRIFLQGIVIICVNHQTKYLAYSIL